VVATADTLAVARTDQKLIRLAEGADAWLVVLAEALDQPLRSPYERHAEGTLASAASNGGSSRC
jgi:hypothetical protein